MWATQVNNPLEEFDQYFSWPCVDRSVALIWLLVGSKSNFHSLFAISYLLQHQVSNTLLCTWFHVTMQQYSSSCLVEWAFSLSDRTDSACHGNMEKMFGGFTKTMRSIQGWKAGSTQGGLGCYRWRLLPLEWGWVLATHHVLDKKYFWHVGPSFDPVLTQTGPGPHMPDQDQVQVRQKFTWTWPGLDLGQCTVHERWPGKLTITWNC